MGHFEVGDTVIVNREGDVDYGNLAIVAAVSETKVDVLISGGGWRVFSEEELYK